MIRRLLVVLAVVLAFGGVASAVKLPVKTIELASDGSWKTVVETAGAGQLVRSPGGGFIKKAVPKVAGRVPWVGTVIIASTLIDKAMQWFFDELKSQSGSSELNDWWRAGDNQGYPAPRQVTSDGVKHIPDGGIYCRGIRGGIRYTYWKTTVDGNPGYMRANYMASGNPTFAGGYMFNVAQRDATLQQLCDGLSPEQDLSTLSRNNPNVSPTVANIVRDYVDAHPDQFLPYMNPFPTVNQQTLGNPLIDPTVVSVPGSPFGDGDWLQEGLQPGPGNRPHPADGDPRPADGDEAPPVDIDGDLIPDWRDPDDNGDGVPDNEQTEIDQKAKPGEPGYGQRQGDKTTQTTVTEEKIPGGKRRTVVTVTTSPGGDTKKTVTTTDYVTEKKYTPGTPGTPDTPAGPGKIETTTTITTTTTVTTTTAPTDSGEPKTTTITTTSKETEKRTEPGPTPKIGDEDGDGVPDKDDPHPKDPLPEKEDKPSSEDEIADKKERCALAGREWDSVNEKCGGPKKPDDGPVPNNCGDFSIPRLLQHTGSYLRDVIFPCESIKDIIRPLVTVASTKFPFSVASGLNGWFAGAGSGSAGSADLPDSLGVIPLEWGWLTPLWGIIKTIVGVLLWSSLVVWLIDRFTPRAVI